MNRFHMQSLLLMSMLGMLLPVPVAQAAGLDVIGFSEDVRMRVDGRSISLDSGSAAYTIPAGARTTIISGEAALLVEGTILNVDIGDSFLYVSTEGPGQLLVQSGKISVIPPIGDAYDVYAGEFAPFTGPPDRGGAPEPAFTTTVIQVPEVELVEAPPKPSVSPEKAEPQPEFDPIAALGAGLIKLSKFKRPKLNLVIEMRPHYKLSHAYETNIFLVPPDTADGGKTGGGVLGSLITTNNVGSRFIFPFSKRSKATVFYDAEFINYGTQPQTNNAINQKVVSEFRHKGRRGTSWKISDSYINTEDPAFSELVARERRYHNSAHFEFDYSRSRRFFIRPHATHDIHKYLSPTLGASLNRFEALIGTDFGVRLQPKTRLFASYNRQIIHYSAGRAAHSKSHILGFGLEGKLAARLTGKINANVRLRRYDIPVTVGSRQINTFTTGMNLVYKPGRRLETRVGLSRTLTETTFGLNRFYIANRISLGFKHRFRKLSLSLTGSFQTDRYPESTTIGAVQANRRDDLYTAGLGWDYKLRPWLRMGLTYKRAQRHSVFSSSFDYKNDKTEFTMKLSF